MADNFQTGNNKIKLITEYESFIRQRCTRPLMSGENMTSYFKMVTVQQKGTENPTVI
jgi:hypothetical protein